MGVLLAIYMGKYSSPRVPQKAETLKFEFLVNCIKIAGMIIRTIASICTGRLATTSLIIADNHLAKTALTPASVRSSIWPKLTWILFPSV